MVQTNKELELVGPEFLASPTILLSDTTNLHIERLFTLTR